MGPKVAWFWHDFEMEKHKNVILPSPNKPMILTLFAPSFLTALKRACPVLEKRGVYSSIGFIILTFTTEIFLVDLTQLIFEKCK